MSLLLLLQSPSGLNFAQTVTDPVGLLDGVSQALGHGRTHTDPQGIADAAGQASAAVRSQTDPEGLLDAASGGLSVSHILADTLGLTDTASPEAAYEQELLDLLDLLDPLETEGAFYAELTDPLDLLDDVEAGVDLATEFTDTLGLTDGAAAGLAIGVETTDQLGLTDETDVPWWTAALGTRLSGLGRIVLGYAPDTSTATDPVQITDSVSVSVPNPVRVITDAVAVHDGLDAPRFTAVLGSDASLLGWIVLGLPNPVDDLLDEVGLLDSIAWTGASGRIITDPLAVHDGLDVPRFTAVLGSDASLPGWIVLGYGAVPPREQADPVALADSVTATLERLLLDALGLIDAVEVAQGTDATDPIGLTDSLSWTQEQARDLTDPLGLADPVSVVLNQIELTLGDLLGLSDNITQLLAVALPGHVTVTVTPAAGLVVTEAAVGGVQVSHGPAGGLTVAVISDDVDLSVGHGDDLLVSLSP